MTEKKSRSTFSRTVQSIILLFFLVGLPFGSYYYLTMGFQYRKEAIDQLQDYGSVPAFTLRTQTGDLLSSEQLRGRLVVVNFAEKADLQEKTLTLERFARMNQQFDNSEKVLFLTNVIDADSTDRAFLAQQAEDFDIRVDRGWYLLYDDAGQMQAIVGKYPQPQQSELAKKSYAMLVDSSLVVRNFYSLEDEAAVQNLVTHTAMIIPRDKDREDIVFKRQTEK